MKCQKKYYRVLVGMLTFVNYFLKIIYLVDLVQPLSSAESIDASSLHEDQTTDSRTKIPYQDQVSSVEPMVQQQSNRQLTVTEASDETFMAHVIIEQALHLSTVPGTICHINQSSKVPSGEVISICFPSVQQGSNKFLNLVP